MVLFTRSKLLVLMGFLPFAGLASAGACTPGVLTSYLNNFGGGPGTSCTLANLDYFNFYFQSAGTGQVSPDSPGNITVTPGTPGATDLRFSGFQSLSAGQGTLTDFIGFNIDPAPVLTGDSISLDPPSGNVFVDLFTCLPDTPFFVGQSGNPGDTSLYCGTTSTFGGGSHIAINLANPSASIINNNSPLQTSTFLFPGTTGQVGILLRLTLTTTSVGGASLDAIGNQPIQDGQGAGAPEPGTWMLLGTGLLTLVLFRRFVAKRLS
jgi:hypothetical protein